jgi:hypothetical protein
MIKSDKRQHTVVISRVDSPPISPAVMPCFLPGHKCAIRPASEKRLGLPNAHKQCSTYICLQSSATHSLQTPFNTWQETRHFLPGKYVPWKMLPLIVCTIMSSNLMAQPSSRPKTSTRAEIRRGFRTRKLGWALPNPPEPGPMVFFR